MFASTMTIETLVATLAFAAFGGEVSFTRKPTAAKIGNNARIGFAVNRQRDAAVYIENADGKIVRHFVAGVLGQNAAEPPPYSGLSPGEWKGIGKTGGAAYSAVVYSPTRNEVLRWGVGVGFESRGVSALNGVLALDLDERTWSADYEGERFRSGGWYYGSPFYATWLKASSSPGSYLLFRQACWDSKRKRMVVVASNLTAAYDPDKKTWENLSAVFEDRQGRRTESTATPRYDQPFFTPVPGQWGSCAYDPVNDEIVLFPLWVTHSLSGGTSCRAELPEDAGVRAGHFGTFLFDCQTNVWRTPELGGKDILAARKRLADLINEQREATGVGWQALLALRQENKKEAVKRMSLAAEAQKHSGERFAKEKAELQRLAAELKGYEAAQVKDAVQNLAATAAKAEKTQAGLARGKPEDLPVLCSQQRAIYRELRLVRDEDLYVQPLPRCSTSIVYDAKNQVMVMAGGTHLDRDLNDTWVYDCKTKRWQRKAAAPEALEWPGMCYDSKRGIVLYVARKAACAYEAAKDQWFKVGAGLPQNKDAGRFYCDMAYDESRDTYVLIASGSPAGDEFGFLMAPTDSLAPVATTPAPREQADDAPFPPPADPAALERMKTMPTNTWVKVNTNVPIGNRGQSNICWDAVLRCLVFQGGGHAGSMDNSLIAYFPESDQWVQSFPGQFGPETWGRSGWQCAWTVPAFERGMHCAEHARYWEIWGGTVLVGTQAGFEWSTRERPMGAKPGLMPLQDCGGPLRYHEARGGRAACKVPFQYCGGICLYPEKGQLILVSASDYYGAEVGREMYVYDIAKGQGRTIKTTGPLPSSSGEGNFMVVQPDKNVLVYHGARPRNTKEAANETWVLELADPIAWQKFETRGKTPPMVMAKFNAIPGTDLVVCANVGETRLWVFSHDRRAWKPLEIANPQKFECWYVPIVWDPHHKVFVLVHASYGPNATFLMKPDFKAIQWDEDGKEGK